MKLPSMRMGLLAVACSLSFAVLQPSAVYAEEIAPVARAAEVVRQPNVLILFADDLGYADAGFQNQSRDVRTPNLDRLAAAGAVMTAGYVTAGVCGPSRAGLLTGRYQQRFGYHDNVAPYVRDRDVEQGLPVEVPTIANYFRDRGYRTGMVGKWHDGDPKKYWPHNRGFEAFFGFNNGAANYFVGPNNQKEYLNKPYSAIYRNDDPVPDFEEYLTDRFGREAVEYIDRHQDEPFFLYVSFNAIHGPLQATEEDLKRFAHIEDENRRTSVAMGYNMDKNIGLILNKLEELGLKESTLIFFLSDNGGKANGNYSWNHPLRGQKGSYWDGGIRIPFTVTWKGTIPAGQRLDEPVSSLDILATSLAAAEVEIKKEARLEGVNLMPYLTGKESQLEDRYLYWDNSRSMAVRDRNWKLVIPTKNNHRARPQLFKISEDVGEEDNLMRQFPQEAARLQEAYERWNADNDTPRWGWAKRNFPYTNGYRHFD